MVLRCLLVTPRRVLVEKERADYMLYPSIAGTCQTMLQESHNILYNENALLVSIRFRPLQNITHSSLKDLHVKIGAIQNASWVEVKYGDSKATTRRDIERIAMRFRKLTIVLCPEPDHVLFSMLWLALPPMQLVLKNKAVQLIIGDYVPKTAFFRLTPHDNWAQIFTTIQCTQIYISGVSKEVSTEVENAIASKQPRVNLQRSINQLRSMYNSIGRPLDHERELHAARDTFNVPRFLRARAKLAEEYKESVARELRAMHAFDADLCVGPECRGR